MAKRIVACLVVVLLSIFVIPSPPVLADGTTEVKVIKYASDGTTVLEETTKTWEWMRDNVPVYGDGETHYYFQGPVFIGEWQNNHPGETWDDAPICQGDIVPGTEVVFQNPPSEYCIVADRWNPQEDTNCGGPEGAVPKDLGAVMGTSVSDLCDLVGGLSAGDTVRVRAIDGFYKEFPAEIFISPPAALGPGILCWYTKDCDEGFQGTGYVPEFYSGMRLAFLADTSTNPWGRHIFGIKDMVENLPSEIWHYYYGGPGDYYSACGGYQVKWISEIAIYSGEGNSFLDTLQDNYIVVILGVLVVVAIVIGIMIGRSRGKKTSSPEVSP